MGFFNYTIAENKLRNRVWKGCFFYLSTLQLISIEVINVHFVTLSYYKNIILHVALAEVLLNEAENISEICLCCLYSKIGVLRT